MSAEPSEAPGASGPAGTSGAARPPLRRDAERNRRRIIEAAREVFRERGLGATLDDVARHAGVGVGTAYRRFANKEELIDALFDDMAETVHTLTEEAAADPDPWHGLASCLERVCELQSFDRGLREVMLGSGRGPQRQERMRALVRPALDQLLARAKEQGTLRVDVAEYDMPMIQLMVATITERTGHPDLWRRYLRLLLDGLRARPEGETEPLPVVPLGDDELMVSLSASSEREAKAAAQAHAQAQTQAHASGLKTR
ncbi:TetR/AcrR family transcriptional regulator [Streptomyces sp. NPDC091292]|uniref:TetR/AcrR family transcriptional regulator n=1 Tax=Streptomyces sp. NPDC091292 TaxID=3365991 RepID=UPI00382F0C94